MTWPEILRQRLNDLLKVVIEKGSTLIQTEDGKSLAESLKEISDKIDKLEKENEGLKKKNKELEEKLITEENLENKFGGKNNFDENGIYKGAATGSQQGGAEEAISAEDREWNVFFSARKITERDKEIWKNKSGLTPQEAEVAYGNGWKNPKMIKDGKQTYEGDEIEVAIHSKTELDKVNLLIKEIKTKTTFKLVDDWKNDNEWKITSLVDEKLPAGKKQEDVKSKIENHRSTLKYRINFEDNEKEGDGLSNESWQKVLEIRNKVPEVKKRGKLTAKMLNQFLIDNGVELPLNEN